MEQALTVKEAAHQLSVSTRTVYRMIDDNQIDAGKVRGVYRISPEAVRKALAPNHDTQQDDSAGLDVQGVNACQNAKTVSIVDRTRQNGGQVSSVAAAKELAVLLKLPTEKKRKQF